MRHPRSRLFKTRSARGSSMGGYAFCHSTHPTSYDQIRKFLSSPALAMVPSGSTARHHTELVWPVSVATLLPSRQRRTVLSELPLTMVPSDSTARQHRDDSLGKWRLYLVINSAVVYNDVPVSRARCPRFPSWPSQEGTTPTSTAGPLLAPAMGCRCTQTTSRRVAQGRCPPA